MGAIWIIAEPTATGGLATISTEIATLGRSLAASSGRELVGVVVAADPAGSAADLAAYLPSVLSVTETAALGHAWATIAAQHVAAMAQADLPDLILVGAGLDGRDVAGVVSALTGLGVLANAVGLTWTEGGPAVEMSIFGGKFVTTSVFTAGRGIVTVRPKVVVAEPAVATGAVVAVASGATLDLPAVAVVDRVHEAGAAVSIEEARIIVAGGRGVGGPEGFGLVGQLATALGGAVGASRAAVDSGWIPYAQQIGQTGKIVKPQLYLALGISGAIQHKVGMQTAGTIVAVNRDPDAPIAEFADVLVIGDLFEVGPALLGELRARAG
jgi:electron transfer flavoprotein alpha subunit